MEEKLSNAWVQVIRQMTSPLTFAGVSVVCVTFLAYSALHCDLPDGWRGWLAVALVAVLCAIIVSVFLMAVLCPRNLTFDKEAHLAIDVRINEVEEVATMLPILARDLASASADKLAQMAESIKEAESRNEGTRQR